jgi:hypothetical protein
MLENKTTGQDQSAEMIEYARLNIHRMQRLEKTIQLDVQLIEAVKNIRMPIEFIVLSEGWCGDAAQNIPVFALMEKVSANLKLCILLRDENLEIMDAYLTNGGRSIPKLICVNSQTKEQLFVWGPRPQACQEIMTTMKEQGLEKKEIAEKIHAWYAMDKTNSLQKEFVVLINSHLN